VQMAVMSWRQIHDIHLYFEPEKPSATKDQGRGVGTMHEIQKACEKTNNT